MIATRASGTTTVRYGTMRENTLALQVVTADGSLVSTGSRARKSAAGYDLTHLFVGSEGTLGLIVEATLRLHGLPETILAGVWPFETLEGAVQTVIATSRWACRWRASSCSTKWPSTPATPFGLASPSSRRCSWSCTAQPGRG
jgi:FAD/FMN-containing dehydrogenase